MSNAVRFEKSRGDNILCATTRANEKAHIGTRNP